MRYEVFIVVIMIICLGLILFYNTSGKQQGRVCFKVNCFNVSLALTSDEQSKGLMLVNHLDDGRGMLFVFDKDGIYPFWMKNTLIPLDIIWVDSSNKVVFMSRNTQPCMLTCDSINLERQARYVLEINAGISDKIGLAVGDEIAIDYMRTQKIGPSIFN